MKYVKIFILVAVALFAVNSAVVCAEPAAYTKTINLEKYSSEHVRIDKKITHVFVASKEIVHVHQPTLDSPNEFVITAQDKVGSVTVFVWLDDGKRYEYKVNVSDEEFGQATFIEQAIGLPGVHVRKVGKRILLTGTVKNQYERNYALQTARLYVEDSADHNLSVGSNVDLKLNTMSATNATSQDIDTNKIEDSGAIIDLLVMENPIQIRLEAQVIEINSDKAKDLGIHYSYNPDDIVNNDGIFQFGENYDRTYKTHYYRDATGAMQNESWADQTPFTSRPLKWLTERFGPVNARIKALVTKGDAKILSRPNVTTMSGEQATIHIGGQLPYQTVDSNGQTKTDFKEFGIILQFKPILDAQSRITSAVHTEVSSLGDVTPDGQYIINTRFADSVINIDSGSTMIVGGLMDSSESKNISKIPLLGDIPILGEFFKYTSKSRDKRELVILVTPYVVETSDMMHAGMSDDMRNYYYSGQREQNELNNVDLNSLPPPFTEEDKKSKKDRKSKKSKNPSTEKQTTSNKENSDVEIFGDDF